MSEKKTLITDKFAGLFAVLYWLGSFALGGIFGIYMIYHVIEVPGAGLVEKIFLSIFAAIALFFSWGIPLVLHKDIDTEYLKKYTIGFVLILIVIYFIARLIFRAYGL
jgi:hypothetical protein